MSYQVEEMQCRALLEIQNMIMSASKQKTFTDFEGVFPLLEKQSWARGYYIGSDRAGNDVYGDIILTEEGLSAIERCRAAKE